MVTLVALGAWLGMNRHEPLALALANMRPAADTTVVIQYGLFSQIDGIVINPADAGAHRFLMVSIGLEAGHARVLDEVAEKDVVLRDAVMNRLGVLTVAELADIRQREALKESLRHEINRHLRRGELDRLYFTQFVIQ